MDPFITLIIGFILALAVFKGYGSLVANGNRLTYEQTLSLVLQYAPDVAMAVAQIFKHKDIIDKEERDRQRKQYAMALMFKYAKQYNLEITPDVEDLISAAIEAAVAKM